MPPPVVLVTAALTGLAAVVLTPWMRAVADSESRWRGVGLHALLAALGGAGAALLAAGWGELVAFALLALAGALLVVVDLAVHRLPDAIVGPTYPVLLAALAVAAATGGGWGSFGRAAAAGAILVVGYFVMAFIAPSGLGLGDVKLSGLLGLFLGWLGWEHVFIGSLAAFVVGGLVAVVLVVAKRARRDTDFAFGPSMIAGAVIGAGWGPALLG